jgi:hypothetical protein
MSIQDRVATPASIEGKKRSRVALAFRLAALFWIAGTIGLSAILRPNREDFAQYYMGGVIAAHGQWASLYPIPIESSTTNPGYVEGSTMKPKYAQLAQERGVGDVARFFQPPPASLLFAPFGVFSYSSAYRLWMLLLIFSGWIVACQAGRFFELCIPDRAKWSGLIVLIAAVSPLMYRTIRTAQVSVFVALLIGWAILAMLKNRNATGGLAIVLGAVLKYVTVVFVLLIAAMKNWKLLLWTIIIGAALALLSIAIMGIGPFIEFFYVIVPRLDRPAAWAGNQSIAGLILRLAHRDTLPEDARTAIRVAQSLTLLFIIWLLFRQEMPRWRQPTIAAAAASLLLMWMLIFSPLYWEHYGIYLVPFWGWVLAEVFRSRARMFLAVIGIGSLYVPIAVIPRVHLAEPFRTHMLFGTILLMVLCVMTLWPKNANTQTPVAP